LYFHILDFYPAFWQPNFPHINAFCHNALPVSLALSRFHCICKHHRLAALHAGLILSAVYFICWFLSFSASIRTRNRYVELLNCGMHQAYRQIFETSRRLWTLNVDRKSLKSNCIFKLLNTIHQNIREVLISSHTTSGSSNQNRKMLLVFISLVEIPGTCVIHTVLISDTNRIKIWCPKVSLHTYRTFYLQSMASLKQLSKSGQKKVRNTFPNIILFTGVWMPYSLHRLWNDLENYRSWRRFYVD
jgi:hypothetical protein